MQFLIHQRARPDVVLGASFLGPLSKTPPRACFLLPSSSPIFSQRLLPGETANTSTLCSPFYQPEECELYNRSSCPHFKPSQSSPYFLSFFVFSEISPSFHFTTMMMSFVPTLLPLFSLPFFFLLPFSFASPHIPIPLTSMRFPPTRPHPPPPSYLCFATFTPTATHFLAVDTRSFPTLYPCSSPSYPPSYLPSPGSLLSVRLLGHFFGLSGSPFGPPPPSLFDSGLDCDFVSWSLDSSCGASKERDCPPKVPVLICCLPTFPIPGYPFYAPLPEDVKN